MIITMNGSDNVYEVAVTMLREDYEELKKKVSGLADKARSAKIMEFVLSGFNRVESNRYEKDTITLHWLECAWSYSDPVCGFVKMFVETVETDFIKLGMEDNDIETYYELDACYINLVRRIDID